ncbi:MAG: alpha/beta hydrolase fold domain-containing protein [Deltaproteobacteria bacterium]|nr:alpha/beta hydrolase fold domain-containing protein [Deltaproteobacteria bacterium]
MKKRLVLLIFVLVFPVSCGNGKSNGSPAIGGSAGPVALDGNAAGNRDGFDTDIVSEVGVERDRVDPLTDGSTVKDGTDSSKPGSDAGEEGGRFEDAAGLTDATGWSEAAALPDAVEASTAEIFHGDLSQTGPYSVVEQNESITVDSGNLTATVYAPDDTRDAPYPLVIVLPGFLASYLNYAVYSTHMASWGFVVVGINFTNAGDHPQCAQDVLQTIDWVKAQDKWQSTDTTNVATVGHSAGGKIAYFAAVLDPARIRAVIGWDPVNAAGPPCGMFGAPDDPNAACNANPVAPNPTAGQAGLLGSMTAAALTFASPVSMFNPAEHHAEFFYKGSPTPAMYVYFVNGAHTNWGVGAAPVEESICKPMGTAWLLRHLKGMVGDDIAVHLPPLSPEVTIQIK